MLTSSGGRPRRRERKKRPAEKLKKRQLQRRMAELTDDKDKMLSGLDD